MAEDKKPEGKPEEGKNKKVDASAGKKPEGKPESAKPEEKPDYLKDARRYEYGALGLFLQKTNPSLLPYAIGELANSMNAVSDTESSLINTIKNSKDGLNAIFSIYPKKYQSLIDQLTLPQFTQSYDEMLSKYLSEDDKKKITSVIESNPIKIGELEKKLGEISYKLEGHEKGYLKLEDKDVEKLQKDAEKYSALETYVKTIQTTYLEDLTQKLVPKFRKDYFKELAEGISKIK